MTTKFRKTAAALTLACIAPFASADVLNFDDLGPGKAFFESYDGFTFGTLNGLAEWFYTDEVTTYNLPHSGASYISTDYNDYAADGSFQAAPQISNATAFTFQGAWFSDEPAFATPDSITYKLYSGTTLVYTSTPSAALSATPTFVSSGYDGLITGVVVIGQQGFYAMDDFTYNVTAAVPEPGTYALMLAGLAAIGFVARRRRTV